jgi:hypothetical protein
VYAYGMLIIALKPHCIQSSHFKVDDVSALEPSSKPPSYKYALLKTTTTSLHQQCTPCQDPGYGLVSVTTSHCIRWSHFKVDDVGADEASSKLPVRIVEENVTASLHQQCTP